MPIIIDGRGSGPNGTYLTRILGFNHDVLENDASKTAGISFEFSGAICEASINQIYTTESSWMEGNNDCGDAYYYLNNNSEGLYKLLQSQNEDLIIKSVLKHANKPSWGRCSWVGVKMWLLSASEVWDLPADRFGIGDSYVTSVRDGRRYKYYKKLHPRTDIWSSGVNIKYDSRGYKRNWWLRSSSSDRGEGFCWVDVDGAINKGGVCYNKYWISPGFAIGESSKGLAGIRVGNDSHPMQDLDTLYPELSWGMLKKIANQLDYSYNGKLEIKVTYNNKEYTIGIGDTKSIIYNGLKYKVRILGFKDDLLQGGGIAGISFEFIDALCELPYYNPILVSTWNGYSPLKGTVSGALCVDLINGFEVENALKVRPAKKVSCDNSGVNPTLYSTELFLLSCSEVWSSGATNDYAFGYCGESEGGRYTFYKYNNQANNLIKSYNNSACSWWLRSPKKGTAGAFCSVSSSGEPTYYSSTESLKVAPGFCL